MDAKTGQDGKGIDRVSTSSIPYARPIFDLRSAESIWILILLVRSSPKSGWRSHSFPPSKRLMWSVQRSARRQSSTHHILMAIICITIRSRSHPSKQPSPYSVLILGLFRDTRPYRRGWIWQLVREYWLLVYPPSPPSLDPSIPFSGVSMAAVKLSKLRGGSLLIQ